LNSRMNIKKDKKNQVFLVALYEIDFFV
jgi:hypothetical protein